MDIDQRDIWLSKFVLGASARVAREKELKEEAFVISPAGKKYYVLSKIGQSKHYTVYGCLVPSEDGSRQVVSLLKIAIQSIENKLLETEAFVLTRLRQFADKIDQERPEGSKPFNYGYFFPKLEDSFISSKQGSRRINILSFPDPIDSSGQLTQLSSLISKEHVYVDPRTSIWILGKTLKILGLAHNMNISNGHIDGSNLLIERDYHGVVLFDWTSSRLSDELPVGVRRFEIIQAVKMVIKAMGGDSQTGNINSDVVDGQYMAILKKLLNGEFFDANQAQKYFYQQVESIWPRQYWPFTTIPIGKEV